MGRESREGQLEIDLGPVEVPHRYLDSIQISTQICRIIRIDEESWILMDVYVTC